MLCARCDKSDLKASPQCSCDLVKRFYRHVLGASLDPGDSLLLCFQRFRKLTLAHMFRLASLGDFQSHTKLDIGFMVKPPKLRIPHLPAKVLPESRTASLLPFDLHALPPKRSTQSARYLCARSTSDWGTLPSFFKMALVMTIIERP